MGLLAAIPVIGTILEKIIGVVDQVIPDKDLALKLKTDLQVAMMGQDYQVILKEIEDKASARALAMKEAENDVWFARLLRGTFRPLTGYAFVGIYLGIKVYILYIGAKFCATTADVISLMKQVWNQEDFIVMGIILTFYFGLRSLSDKKGSTGG